MTPEQKHAFDQRRQTLMHKHMQRDPRVRAALRMRRLGMLRGVLGCGATLMLTLMLVKGFLLAFHGGQGYAQMLAPVLAQHAPESVLHRTLAADPVAEVIAGLIAPLLPHAAPASAVVQRPPGAQAAEPET